MKPPTFEDAIALALEAHHGQVDKVGQPYVLHGLRVMLRLSSPDEQMVAVLHDVVEDTEYSLDDLRAKGYPQEVIAAIDAVTRRDGESYEQFIERAARNPIARREKLADLEDNMDLRRLPELDGKALERLQRYIAAWRRLTSD